MQRALRLCGDKASASDLVQDTMERALSRRRTFEGENLLAWTTRIMRNRFIDLRRGHRLSSGASCESLPAPSFEPDPMDQILNVIDLDDLGALLAELEQKDRELFRLAYFEGWSHRAIAHRMVLEVSTTGTRLFRIKARLRKSLASVAAARHGRAREGHPAHGQSSSRGGQLPPGLSAGVANC